MTQIFTRKSVHFTNLTRGRIRKPISDTWRVWAGPLRSDCRERGSMWKTGGKSETIPFQQQWMVRSDLLVPETSTHITLSTKHTTPLPGVSQCSAEHRDSPWASPGPWLCSFLSWACWSHYFKVLEQDPAMKLNEHRCCFLHMPEVYTAHRRSSTDGFHWPSVWRAQERSMWCP